MIDEKEMSEGNNGRVAQAEEITRILRMLDEERRNCKMNRDEKADAIQVRIDHALRSIRLERDEARREVCELVFRNDAGYVMTREEIAEERGWDCLDVADDRGWDCFKTDHIGDRNEMEER